MRISIGMVTTTKGRELLASAASTSSQVQLAKDLGRTQATVSRWIAGMARPDPVSRMLMSRKLGIPVDAWLTADELNELSEEELSEENQFLPTGT